MILLIDNYDSFTFNLYQLIQMSGHSCQVFRNDQLSIDQIEKLNPEKIVISPGPGNPDSAGIGLSLIKNLCYGIPTLGVCLGHQTIAQAFGAKIIRAKKGQHGKVSTIYHNGKGLFQEINGPFKATRYHSLIVDHHQLPDCLEITASTRDGVIMGLKHRQFPIEGVQFHPESIASEHGPTIIQNFLKQRSAS